MDVKVYMDSYMASNGSCFMVTWTILKNHLLEVGPTQNQKTMALQTLTTIDLLYFLMCEDTAWIEIHWTQHLVKGPVTIWLHTTIVENMVKKNHNRFPLRFFWPPWSVVTKRLHICFFWFYDCNFENMGACNTSIEMYFQDLSSSISKVPKILNSMLVNQKNKSAFILWQHIKVAKRTAMEKKLQFFFTMFSTSDYMMLGGVLGRPWDTFFWALTIIMVTTLGSCVKWPIEPVLPSYEFHFEGLSKFQPFS